MSKSSAVTGAPTAKAGTAKKVRPTTTPVSAEAANRPGEPDPADAARVDPAADTPRTAQQKAAAVTAPSKKATPTARAASATARKAAAQPADGGSPTPAAAKAAGRRVARGAARSPSRSGGSVPEVHAIAEQLAVADDESPWTSEELEQVQADLLAEREVHRREIEEAEAELGNLLRGSGDGAGDDQADAGAKTFEREHEIALANNARDMLRQVERALEQLGAGTYGVCENCGRPIGKLRLQAYPRATLCMPCKKNQERH